jgi:thiol-disulfide isomerase/thioredoxin
MVERLFITILIGALAVGAYLLLNHWQRRRAAVANPQKGTPGHTRVLYFHSQHCGACRTQGHYLAQLDNLHRALIEPIDVDQSPELARQYNILTLPTTILIDREGRVRHVNSGLANPLKLTRQLEEYLKF